MKNATATWLLAECFGLAIVAGLVSSAAAQPELNKIEAKIRQQLQQPENSAAAGQPGNGQSGVGPNANSPVAGGGPHVTVVEIPAPLPQPPQPAPLDNRAQPGPTRTYLGITAADEASHGGGVRLLRVHPGGPGDKAGLQPGDTILSLGGMRIGQMADMANLLDVYKPGEKVLLQVFRNGQTQKIELTLGMRPSPADLASEPAGVAPPVGPPLPAFPPQPQVLVPPPHVIVPPSEGPALALPQPNTDRLRIEQLQQRVDQLERRLERLEHEQSAKGR
jgi:hypothetical protein